MTKFTLKRNPNTLPRKLARLKHEIRTQPITTAIAVGLMILAVAKCAAPEADAAVPEMILVPTEEEFDLHVDPLTPSGAQDTTVSFSKLGKAKKVGGLMGAYFGVKASKDRPAILPETMDVNWADNLKSLWVKKTNIANATPATRKNAEKIVLAYATADRDTKGMPQFVQEVGAIVRETHASIDYPSLCGALKIEDTSCTGYKTVMGRFNGLNLVAYGMTEIFPAQNGLYNFRAMDTLLQHAGENYIDSIPALGDGLLSKGFYQFTSYAVRRDDTALGGANFVDNHAGMKLPGSVLYLNGRNSHKAAFEFAAYNIGMLVRKLNDKDVQTLVNKCSTEQLTEVVATSHHMPTRAVSNAQRWIKEGCKKPYRAYTGEHLGTYAKKTAINYDALKKYL